MTDTEKAVNQRAGSRVASIEARVRALELTCTALAHVVLEDLPQDIAIVRYMQIMQAFHDGMDGDLVELAK